ncbi:MAG: hypothetical protein HQL76_16510 [Magnetococcales bacterium]|nr:hypothetical protein [Magnetococcales bacterium]
MKTNPSVPYAPVVRDGLRASLPPPMRYIRFLIFLLAVAVSFLSVSAQAADMLPSGAMMTKNQALVSANERYILIFQNDGNLVLYDRTLKRPIWNSNTANKGGNYLIMQTDGNLVIRKALSHSVPLVWETNTDGRTGSFLLLPPDGNLTVLQGTAMRWESKTREDGMLLSGQTLKPGPEKKCILGSNCIKSGGNGTYYAVFQEDGNFVLYNSSYGAEWNSDTDNKDYPAYYLGMETDGNLVIKRGSTLRWESKTSGNPGAFLVMQKDKKLVIYNKNAEPIWSSDWNKSRHCGTWDIECRAEKTFSNLADWVKDAYEDARNAANKTSSAINSAIDRVESESKAITQDALKTLATTAKSVYSTSVSAVKSGYEASVAALKSAWNAALEAIFKATGTSFINKNKDTLLKIQNILKNLDDDGKSAYNRIQNAIAKGEITAQVGSDMKMLASKFGMVAGTGNNLPENMTNSCWGIPLMGVDAAFVVGAETSLAMAMNVQPDSSGKYTYAIVSYTGGSLGASIQGSVNVLPLGFFWSPGTINDNKGWSVGFGVEASAGIGIDTGLSWNVEKGMSGASNAIPGISMQSATGGGIDGSFKAGYTSNLVTMTF